MSYNAKILLDSISETGKRITTFEITFPRIVLAEFNTHRMFSRNSASSRAIPFKKQLERIIENPFIPEQFPIDGKGMQPNSYITKEDENYTRVLNYWLEARDKALASAESLYASLGIGDDWDWRYDEKPKVAIHKQIVNRLLEPFQWHTVIITATEFDNFFKLRTNENAQYEIRRIADLMYEAYHSFDEQFTNPSEKVIGNNWEAIKPQKLKVGEWHLPLYNKNEDENSILNYIKNNVSSLRNQGYNLSSNHEEDYSSKIFKVLTKRISVARCARVSYLTHDGKRDIEKDLELFEKLRTSGHWSPFEHIATPYFEENSYSASIFDTSNKFSEGYEFSDRFINLRSGNFLGWKQFRKEFQDENCTFFRKENQC